MRLPKLFLDDDHVGKVIGINLFVGKRPHASFGNSTGDCEMVEWTGAGEDARLKMLVHHDVVTVSPGSREKLLDRPRGGAAREGDSISVFAGRAVD